MLVYHAELVWMPGGFLGVDVFFVISGFLITSLLLTELDRSGHVDLRRFFRHRVRRLLPGLLLVLVAALGLVAFVAPDAAAGLRHDAVPALFGVGNWWYLLSSQSYFEVIGRPSLLRHTWSVAVEAQFYLVWPVVVIAVYRWFNRRGVRLVAWICAFASTALVVTLAVRGGVPVAHDPTRLYFGSDTHAAGLCVGAALATFWRPELLRPALTAGARRFVELLGVCALGALVYAFITVSEFSLSLYRGGFLAVAVITMILIAAACHPGARLGRLLDVAPLRWVGTRSYGLYLWHWPIFMVTRPGLDLELHGLPDLVLRLALTAGAAELSYRFVEVPVRRGAIGRMLARARSTETDQRRPARRRLVLSGVGMAACVVVLSGAAATSARSEVGGRLLANSGHTSPPVAPPHHRTTRHPTAHHRTAHDHGRARRAGASGHAAD